jgi:hypothetical protein
MVPMRDQEHQGSFPMNRLHATFAFERLGWTRRKGSKSKPDDSSFARREEEKWDAEYSVPPGNDACSQCGRKKPRPSEVSLAN